MQKFFAKNVRLFRKHFAQLH